jgi:hypothetical protein
MEIGHVYNRFHTQVQPALISKVEEFRLLGYETIDEGALWEFLIHKKWKKAKEEVPLSEIVNDILSVKVGEYMNYATIEAFRMDDFAFDDEEGKKELLR